MDTQNDHPIGLFGRQFGRCRQRDTEIRSPRHLKQKQVRQMKLFTLREPADPNGRPVSMRIGNLVALERPLARPLEAPALALELLG